MRTKPSRASGTTSGSVVVDGRFCTPATAPGVVVPFAAAWRLYGDVPGVALVRIEVEAEDVEQADVGIVVRVVLCVPLIVHDLHRPVVAWRPTGLLVVLATAVVPAAAICGGLGVTWRIPAVARRVAVMGATGRRIGVRRGCREDQQRDRREGGS